MDLDRINYSSVVEVTNAAKGEVGGHLYDILELLTQTIVVTLNQAGEDALELLEEIQATLDEVDLTTPA